MASVLFGVYLVWVSCQDLKEMQVVRYTHLLGAGAIVMQVLSQRGRDTWNLSVFLMGVFLLVLLQMAACRFKWYGFADIIVFFLCGVFLLLKKGAEKCLLAYFMMQAIAGSFLLVMQLLKKNVKGLNLRRPVPYIPYISVAFILTNMVL